MKSIILDYMLKFNPNPIVFYNSNKPLALSKSYLKITGYSYEEIMNYFATHGEITTLLYKETDLEEVKNILDMLKKETNAGAGYTGLSFTLTRKDGIRVKIPWSNHIYMKKNKGDTVGNMLSFRIGELTNIELV